MDGVYILVPEEEYRHLCEIENIIEDIRAEIDEQYDRIKPYNIDVANGLEMADEIINKHISGKEDEDADCD